MEYHEIELGNDRVLNLYRDGTVDFDGEGWTPTEVREALELAEAKHKELGWTGVRWTQAEAGKCDKGCAYLDADGDLVVDNVEETAYVPKTKLKQLIALIKAQFKTTENKPVTFSIPSYEPYLKDTALKELIAKAKARKKEKLDAEDAAKQEFDKPEEDDLLF